MKNIKINHLHLDKKGLEVVLNDLESDILRFLWEHEDSTVRRIYDKLGKKKNVALTTIGVTLDRMHQRGLTKRKLESGRGGLKYLYSASMSRDELGKSVAESVAEKLASAFGGSVKSHLKK